MVRITARVLTDGAALQTIEELFNLALFARATATIPGGIAEIGVYRGGSARILAQYRGNRELHLFDTFAGIPTSDPRDVVRAGDFAASLKDVQRYIGQDESIFYHAGAFPSTASAVNNSTFSMLHIDVDTYQGTAAALEVMYPLISAGGFIVSHDYSAKTCPGVKSAVDEFFVGRPECVIPLAGTTQCLIVKH